MRVRPSIRLAMRRASNAEAKESSVKLSSKTKTKRSGASSLLGRKVVEAIGRISRKLSILWVFTLSAQDAVTIDVLAFPRVNKHG